MGIERTLKRKQQQEVKKMYDREMRKMATMTDAQKVTHLAHLSRNMKTVDPNNLSPILSGKNGDV
jgi:hypothetical protein